MSFFKSHLTLQPPGFSTNKEHTHRRLQIARFVSRSFIETAQGQIPCDAGEAVNGVVSGCRH